MVDPVPIAQIPEPGTLAVLPLGLLGMLGLARRRRS
ncbi:MAG TPA: PEP-CTERM sorting domain-containing protein [Thiobacillus sp.]|nr:PEP-CTERM sorting domain-containing protein [Thiobacillus sp.]HQT71451.1 PEP-CTERM sorting domain-containing protein [Thiobacillus sp.]